MARKQSHKEQTGNGIRAVSDLAALFVIAVMLIRGLVIEGFLITTGSMAPGLLGYHRRIECPECGFEFSVGTSFDDSVADQDAGSAGIARGSAADCPNCGLRGLNVSRLPINHGDQLLVLKGLQELRPPRRWEPVVFRNPAWPVEPYLKRLVGLPGETVLIQHGDVYIDGQLTQRDYRTQLSMRVPVFDLSHLPDADVPQLSGSAQAETTDPRADVLWRMPWEFDPEWSPVPGGIRFRSTRDTRRDARIRLRPWRRSGGDFPVSVRLESVEAVADWNQIRADDPSMPVRWLDSVSFDQQSNLLTCRGVMAPAVRNRLCARAESAELREAVRRLAELSHYSPLTDACAYNGTGRGPREHIVRDLMVSLSIEWRESPAAVVVQLPIGSESAEVRVLPQENRVEVIRATTGEVIASSPTVLTDGRNDDVVPQMTMDVSNFDGSILVAVNDRVVIQLPPKSRTVVGENDEDVQAESARMQRLVSVGVTEGDVTVTSLRLFRDVYFTRSATGRASDAPFRIPENSYFVLGDNTAVSYDSRSWDQACVPTGHVVGRPLLLHLPSQPGRLTFRDTELPIRLPDRDRIRILH